MMLTFGRNVTFDRAELRIRLGSPWNGYINKYEMDAQPFYPQLRAVPDYNFRITVGANDFNGQRTEVVEAINWKKPTSPPKIFKLGQSSALFETRDGFFRRILRETDPSYREPVPAKPLGKALYYLQRMITG